MLFFALIVKVNTLLISDSHVHTYIQYKYMLAFAFAISYLHLLHITIFPMCVLHRGLDLVNIHLFHDASNLVACNSSPSIYSANRKNALRYVINRSEQ